MTAGRANVLARRKQASEAYSDHIGGQYQYNREYDEDDELEPDPELR